MRRYTITRIPNYWEISPGISGYTRRHLAISGAVNAFQPWIHVFPRQFSHVPSLTATDLSTVRPHTFRAAAGRLSRALAPAACRLARLSSPGRMSSRGRAGTGLLGPVSVSVRIPGHGQTTMISRTAHRPGAPRMIVLRAARVYKSGSPPEDLFPPRPAHSTPPGYSTLKRSTDWSTD